MGDEANLSKYSMVLIYSYWIGVSRIWACNFGDVFREQKMDLRKGRGASFSSFLAQF